MRRRRRRPWRSVLHPLAPRVTVVASFRLVEAPPPLSRDRLDAASMQDSRTRARRP